MTANTAVLEAADKDDGGKITVKPLRSVPAAPAPAVIDNAAQRRAYEALDMRGAACLNFIELCRAQSSRGVYTNADYRAFRIMMGAGEELVKLDSNDAIVPAGCGEAIPVRNVRLDAIAEALDAAGDV